MYSLLLTFFIFFKVKYTKLLLIHYPELFKVTQAKKKKEIIDSHKSIIFSTFLLNELK